MRLLLTFVLGLLLSINSYSQSDSINQTNPDNGRKTGYWIITGSISKIKGYGPNDKVEEGTYKNSRKNSLWKKYWPNGNLKSEIIYKNGRSTGSYTTYFSNGKTEEKGTMQNGLLVDNYELYWPNGETRQVKSFNQLGATEGRVQYFYENGQPELDFTTINGIETGKSTWYFENGDKKREVTYSDGGTIAESINYERKNVAYVDPDPAPVQKGPKIQGDFNSANSSLVDNYGKTYDDNKNILMDGEFKGGRLYNGRHYIYDEFGLLDHIKEYRDGIYVGNGIIGKKDKF
jgi:antitoxin component YwqK of YwqJK toxin-antitoxin module